MLATLINAQRGLLCCGYGTGGLPHISLAIVNELSLLCAARSARTSIIRIGGGVALLRSFWGHNSVRWVCTPNILGREMSGYMVSIDLPNLGAGGQAPSEKIGFARGFFFLFVCLCVTLTMSPT